MDPREIKIEIYRRRISMSAIARSLGISVPAVDHVIRGRNKTPRIRKRVSEFLNIPVSELWPGGDGGTAHRHPAGERKKAA